MTASHRAHRVLAEMALLTIAVSRAVYAGAFEKGTTWQGAVMLWAVVAILAWYLLESDQHGELM